MTDALHGFTYVVTGASSGIGRATAALLARRGAHVIAADLEVDEVNVVVRSERSCAGSITPFELDVTDRSSWNRVLSDVHDRHGRIDGLVSCAGITKDRSLRKMTDDEWRRVIDVHLRAAWLGAQILADDLAVSDHGAIVNLSSSGRHGSFGQTNYAAAKAGIVGLTKTLALELGRHGVRCNVVAPGPVRTPMLATVPEATVQTWLSNITLRRLAEPEEVAEAIIFLLSPAASFITGHVLEVNGGEFHL